MKSVGIIGGLGPETTSKFYLEVVFSCFEKDKTSRPPILIWNVPIPYQIEENFITKGHGKDQYLPYLVQAAQRLEKGGIDFIVIPCNSVHILIDQVREAVKIPILSIIEETVISLKRKNVTEVGILATPATIRNKLYENKLLENQIKVHKPDEEDQRQIGKLINKLVRMQQEEKDEDELLNIIHKFIDKEIRTVLLACTDLQLICPKIPNAEILDTMEILAQATVREVLK